MQRLPGNRQINQNAFLPKVKNKIHHSQEKRALLTRAFFVVAKDVSDSVTSSENGQVTLSLLNKISPPIFIKGIDRRPEK